MALATRAFSDPKRRQANVRVLKDPDVKREFGQRIIDEIVRRTQEEQVDKSGKSFRAYSKSYVKSDVFQIYGKSEGDVNLTLTGEMLSSMVVKDASPTGVIIEFASQTQNDKAHGHIHGIRTKTGKVRRDFFGVPEKDQISILKSVIRDANEDAFDFAFAAQQSDVVEGAEVGATDNESDDG